MAARAASSAEDASRGSARAEEQPEDRVHKTASELMTVAGFIRDLEKTTHLHTK
jgi:hypothetical protein